MESSTRRVPLPGTARPLLHPPSLGLLYVPTSLHHELPVYLSVSATRLWAPQGKGLCSKWPVPPIAWHIVGAQKTIVEAGKEGKEGRAGREEALAVPELLKTRRLRVWAQSPSASFLANWQETQWHPGPRSLRPAPCPCSCPWLWPPLSHLSLFLGERKRFSLTQFLLLDST